jgi:exosome complex exonuclease DIS3/RRP44
MTDTIQKQAETIEKQNQQISDLTERLDDAEKSNQDLQHQIWGLEESVEEQEQYSRRTSLRFHNCPNNEDNTDNTIISLCKDRLGMQLNYTDILRSHPIGRPNRNGKIQIICRFQNWKVKNDIFRNKRNLKNSDVFITEDLTKYRQGIIHELTCAKRARTVHSFWTNDGRIFTKLSESGPKYLIRSVSDLHKIAPPPGIVSSG